MPSLVGVINIENVEDGVFTVGDAFRISPNGVAQDRGGEGGFNTGDFMVVTNKKSETNLNDPDFTDQWSLSIKPFLK
jgi:spore germination protein PF